jgi:hypothetical protein
MGRPLTQCEPVVTVLMQSYAEMRRCGVNSRPSKRSPRRTNSETLFVAAGKYATLLSEPYPLGAVAADEILDSRLECEPMRRWFHERPYSGTGTG